MVPARLDHSASSVGLEPARLDPYNRRMASNYRFSFGPWNIHEGADPFGPTVRPAVAWTDKLKQYKKLGFDAVQFHDDDAVPDIESKSPQQLATQAQAMKKTLGDEGLVA